MSGIRCKDKSSFSSKEDAIETLHHIKNQKSEGKIPVRAYYCEYHKKWHLTSTELLTEKAKPVKLKLADQWDNLLIRQDAKDILYSEKPYEKQFEKTLAKIIHNVNIQCEVLDEKFKYRAKKIRGKFNEKQNRLVQKLALIKL